MSSNLPAVATRPLPIVGVVTVLLGVILTIVLKRRGL
jgi:hypothetical protein